MAGPSGTVTLPFTDIVGSTRLWEQHPEAMAAALERHDRLMRSAIEGGGGYVFKTVGDSFVRLSGPVEMRWWRLGWRSGSCMPWRGPSGWLFGFGWR
jgi:class 3 adenylate cyclase